MVRGLRRVAAHREFFLKEMVAVGFLMRLILIVIVLAVAGGAIFLATWDMPAPTSRVEKVIPAERFN
jgi:hypothetical protein